MKLLQLSQKYFSLLGISSKHLKQTENFNIKNLMWIPVFVLNIILYAIFIFHEADSFVEIMFSIYMIAAMIGTFSGLAAIAFRTKKLCNFIKTLEQNVDDSEFDHILNVKLID